ncbi:MAG: putative manganese-dependent inorganic pyrophosphatase [candidate division WWE3 bacterium GW2011_GWA1_41_8]|uniref:inorganic diphosphatase n=1 Tax=candidate division WWE3 bacterium GW2011_GWA1_41_8 TaxID=1619103 RepID=A0A0G1AA72_UNCKA|nr:MAG: putative manganese-dependent inorganic pyrophosphatase [candidate division WWE3 bacterium GW2011_GWA1_41_8]
MKIYIIGHTPPDLDTVASTVTYAEYIKKINRYTDREVVPLYSGNLNNETLYIFEKFNVQIPAEIKDVHIAETDNFILVDHNEESQRDPRVNPAKVLEIVDHHKLNINFTSPIRVDVRPLGSTCSIIYELFKTSKIEPEPATANLILASVLSDTVGLKSTLTTGIDVTIAHEIAEKHDIDIEQLTVEIFKAKSDIEGLSAYEIVNRDTKTFDFKGTKVFIGEVETVEPEKVIEQKAGLIEALEDTKVKKGVGIAYLFIIDILNLNALAVYATDAEREILEKAFTATGSDNVMDIEPRISRKKDIAPAIERVVTG